MTFNIDIGYKMKKHVISIISKLCLNLSAASFIILILSYLSVLSLDIIVNSDIIFGMTFASLFGYFICLDKLNENNKFTDAIYPISQYVFLGLLLIVTANQFLKYFLISSRIVPLTILAIFFGSLTFYKNRERVEKEIEYEKDVEEKAEIKREKEFDKKFKRLQWFNFSYGFEKARLIDNFFKRWLVYVLLVLASPFVWFVRLPYSFVKWMYKEGWWYAIALILILVLFTAINLAQITKNIDVDESHSVNAASSILTRGLPYFPNTDFVYGRDYLYHYLLSIFIFIFGFNEFAGRFLSLISVIWGLFFMYLSLKNLGSSKFNSIIFIFLLSLNSWILIFSNKARMYSVLFLLMVMFMYLISRKNFLENKNILFLFLIFLASIFVYRASLFLIFTLIAIFFFKLKDKINYKKTLILITLFGIILIILMSFIESNYLINFFNNNISQFKGNLLENARISGITLNWLVFFSGGLIFSAIFLLYSLKNPEKNKFYISISLLIGIILIDLLIYSNFPARRFNYAFVVFPIYFLTMTIGLQILHKSFSLKYKKITIFFLLLVFVLNFNFQYKQQSYADFSIVNYLENNSTVYGYPTSPIIFYNLKFEKNLEVISFINDPIESELYSVDGIEVYSGKEIKKSFEEINLKEKKVYFLYEKTRLDFVDLETKKQIFKKCLILTNQDKEKIISSNFRWSPQDYQKTNEIILLECN